MTYVFIGDVVAVGWESACPVAQDTGPLTYGFPREVPVPGSCDRAPIDLVECDDGIGGYVDCVARCPGDVASRDTAPRPHLRAPIRRIKIYPNTSFSERVLFSYVYI